MHIYIYTHAYRISILKDPGCWSVEVLAVLSVDVEQMMQLGCLPESPANTLLRATLELLGFRVQGLGFRVLGFRV